MKIIVKKDQHKSISALWAGQETDMKYDIVLAEPGASLDFQGLLLGDQENSLAAMINITHAAPATRSNIVVKSVLAGRAKTDIHGLVKIGKGAKGTQTWLAAHLLLLSDKAKGLAIPSLEILENDVKAGHATTVGRINDLEIFYLMSRGLSEKTAKQLIVSGFLQQTIDNLPASHAAKARKKMTELMKETNE